MTHVQTTGCGSNVEATCHLIHLMIEKNLELGKERPHNMTHDQGFLSNNFKTVSCSGLWIVMAFAQLKWEWMGMDYPLAN